MTIALPIEPSDIVYGLTDTAMPGLVKIGWTSRELQQRVDALHTTGVPRPFDVAVAYRVDNGYAVEQALHRAFRPYRESDRREFFRMSLTKLRLSSPCSAQMREANTSPFWSQSSRS